MRKAKPSILQVTPSSEPSVQSTMLLQRRVALMHWIALLHCQVLLGQLSECTFATQASATTTSSAQTCCHAFHWCLVFLKPSMVNFPMATLPLNSTLYIQVCCSKTLIEKRKRRKITQQNCYWRDIGIWSCKVCREKYFISQQAFVLKNNIYTFRRSRQQQKANTWTHLLSLLSFYITNYSWLGMMNNVVANSYRVFNVCLYKFVVVFGF